MTRVDLEASVWRHFPRRAPMRWRLVLTKHHSHTSRFPVYQWEMLGRYGQKAHWGFVDPGGVEVVL